MKHSLLLFFTFSLCSCLHAQLSPGITSWLQNTTETGTYYVENNSTEMDNGLVYNCQQVEYSTDFVYITTEGVPAYPTGPFTDNNPFVTTAQGAIFKFPLNPVQETGTPTATTGGRIGVFVNGVSLFDYRDGVAWNANTNALCGGPGNPPCPGPPGQAKPWNRDAVPAEKEGFDCAKGHPAMGNYHHHQNPSAFKYDLVELEDICNLYDSEGLYAIDPSVHSPLIGFAYDGFPIYGAYGYANADGTGGITRIKSGYNLRNITTRTVHADGTDVADGPNVSATYFLGYFREDYMFVANAGEDYLDEHNGRFSVTPEYPDGTYAYYATVDENWNSAYPYIVGPTFHGEYENRLVATISEATTVYDQALPIELLDFQASYTKDGVRLNWVTSTEIDNDYFTIERSEDGVRFTDILEVPSAGNTTTSQTYEGLDPELPVATVYYRLRQTDFDGTSSYADVVSLNGLPPIGAKVRVFPNPSTEFVAVQLTGLVTSKVSISLYDLNGKMLQSATIEPGSSMGFMDVQSLYDGNYLLVVGGTGSSSVTMVTVAH